MSKYQLLLLTFAGAIMAQSGCDKEEALRRIATLCTITETQLGVKVDFAK